MKLWVLVGLFTAASIPWAAASETTECGLDTRQTRVEAPVAAPEERDERKAARTSRQEAEAEASAEAAATAAQRAAARVETRRRGVSVRRIPDAMLIDGRGAL